MAHAVGTMPADFADSNLGGWWRMLMAMDAAGVPYSDPMILLDQLANERFDASYRTPLYVADLIRDGLAAHSKYYAGEVREGARRRKMMRIAVELAERIEQATESTSELRQWLDSQVSAVGEDIDEQFSFYQSGRELIEQLRKPRLEGGGRVAVHTGIPVVDRSLGAMLGAELVILAARPRMGKTALATQIAFHAATSGKRVCYLSLEMAQTELAMRVLSGLAGVNSRVFRATDYPEHAIAALETELESHQALPLTIWAPTRSGVTVSRLRAATRLLAARGDLGLIVVDYLQLLDASNAKAVRAEQVADMTKGLKQLARELKVPVLCLAQLNRTAELEKTPRLGHLRESGAVEQDADIVLFVERTDETTGALLHVAKHRAGEHGAIELDFDPVRTMFFDRGHISGGKRVAEFDDFNAEGSF